MVSHRHCHQHEAISQGAPRCSEAHSYVVRTYVRSFARTSAYVARVLRTLLGIFRGFAALLGVVPALRSDEKERADARPCMRTSVDAR